MSLKFNDLDEDIVYFIIAAIFIIVVSFALYRYGFSLFLVVLVIVPFALLWFKKLDIYFNLEKHKKSAFNVVKYPLILDNSVWLNSQSEENKKIFEMVKWLCKKHKTSFLLLRMQLDEIANIKHKAAKDEDSVNFKKATKALQLIEELQKEKLAPDSDSNQTYLTIRGVSLKKIVELEGEDEEAEFIQKVELQNPLAQEAEITKEAYEGVYKSRLAEGIKDILLKTDSNLAAINLISDNEEIRIKARIYSDILNDKKIDVIDANKAYKSWDYVSKNTPKKIFAELNMKRKAKTKEIDKKKKNFWDKWDFAIKP